MTNSRNTEPLIEAAGLYKSYGDVIAVEDVSLQVAAGEIYGLMGPDGAGKTTTLRLLCGALRPTSGEPSIRIAGCDLLKNTEQARTEIGYLPQRFSLYEEMTVLENIRFFAEVRGLSPQEWRPRSKQILEFVDLSEFSDRRAGHLSGGMKQKLGLAAALVHSPRVLLLDEPTTGVDPLTRQDFWQLIIRLAAASETNRRPAVLISTPYMDEAARCHRVAFMQHAKLKVEGSPAELRAGFQGQVLELSGRPLPLLRRLVLKDEDIQDVQMFGDRLHIHVRAGKAEHVLSRLQDELPAHDVHIDRLRSVPPQLEDVFMSLVEGYR